MDTFVRFLRDGRIREEEGAPLAVILDRSEVPGSNQVFDSALKQFCEAVVQGTLWLLIGARTLAHRGERRTCCRSFPVQVGHSGGSLSTAWLLSQAAGSSCQRPRLLSGCLQRPARLDRVSACIHPSPGSSRASLASRTCCRLGPEIPRDTSVHPDLEQLARVLESRLASTSAGGCAVVVDDLAGLLLSSGAPVDARGLQWWWNRLSALPGLSCLLGRAQTDLLVAARGSIPAAADSLQAALEHLAMCSLSLSLPESLQCSLLLARQGMRPEGQLEVRVKRSTGRVRQERQLFKVQGPAALVLLQPIEGARPQDLLPQNGAPALQSLQLEELTEEQRRARSEVVLPYQHQGDGALYRTGDFKDYLPVEAGGRAAGRKLGTITYVRDSDGEFDSDEDPDDDLDI